MPSPYYGLKAASQRMLCSGCEILDTVRRWLVNELPEAELVITRPPLDKETAQLSPIADGHWVDLLGRAEPLPLPVLSGLAELWPACVQVIHLRDPHACHYGTAWLMSSRTLSLWYAGHCTHHRPFAPSAVFHIDDENSLFCSAGPTLDDRAAKPVVALCTASGIELPAHTCDHNEW